MQILEYVVGLTSPFTLAKPMILAIVIKSVFNFATYIYINNDGL